MDGEGLSFMAVKAGVNGSTDLPLSIYGCCVFRTGRLCNTVDILWLVVKDGVVNVVQGCFLLALYNKTVFYTHSKIGTGADLLATKHFNWDFHSLWRAYAMPFSCRCAWYDLILRYQMA